MKIRKSIWMLGATAVLVACSQEETLQGTGNDGVTTITVSLEDEMMTRAVAADTSENRGVNRYVFEAYESDGVTPANIFNDEADYKLEVNSTYPIVIAKLDKEKNYKIFCWADEGDESSYNTENGLASITLKDDSNPTIAHRGMAEISGTDAYSTIFLTHAVGKVVLQTTSNITNASVAVSTSTCTGYNALTGDYVTESPRTIEGSTTEPITISTATADTPQEVLSFYTLVGEQAFSTTITYNANYSTVLDNVPYQADYRTVLRGNLNGMQYGDATIITTLDEDWEENTESYITLTTAGHLTLDMIEEALIGGGNTLHISGPMNNDDIVALQSYLAETSSHDLSLDLSGVTVLTELPTSAFSGCQHLVSIILPEGFDAIGYSAFNGCSSLKEVTLPSTLTIIGGHAFTGATALETISTPKGSSTGQFADGITSIGENAFESTGLRNIDLSNAEEQTIRENLFHSASVETVKLGNVTSIRDGAFTQCGNLTQLDLSSCTALPSFGNSSFDSGTELKIKVSPDLLEAARACNLVTSGILTAEQFVTEF